MITKVTTTDYIAVKKSKLDYFLKRLLDYVVAVLLLGIFWPILILIAIAIKLDSPGEVFF